MSYLDGIRETADIVRDLLERVERTEWAETYERCSRNCCGKWVTQCPECRADGGTYGEPGYQEHQDGCPLKALILESQAYLDAEEELERSREKASYAEASPDHAR